MITSKYGCLRGPGYHADQKDTELRSASTFQIVFVCPNLTGSGMNPDGLYACFPAFPKEEIEKIYNEVKNKPEDGGEDSVISVNCS